MKLKDEQLQELFDDFTNQMHRKLGEKITEGYGGWDKKYPSVKSNITVKMIKNALRGDWVDVANLAMMLHYQERK